MVVIRINANGSLTQSMPCVKCVQFMKMCGVKRVYYSNWNGDIVTQKISNFVGQHVTIGYRH